MIKPHCGWLQFSLRSMIGLITLVAIGFGLATAHHRHQRLCLHMANYHYRAIIVGTCGYKTHEEELAVVERRWGGENRLHMRLATECEFARSRPWRLLWLDDPYREKGMASYSCKPLVWYGPDYDRQENEDSRRIVERFMEELARAESRRAR